MALTITATLTTFKYMCNVETTTLTYINLFLDYKTAFSKLVPRFLGLYQLMTLSKHISNICRTVYMHIRRINSIRPYLTKGAMKTLIQSVVISRLDYCNCIFVGIPLNSIHRLQLAHNAPARVVCKPPPRAHMTPILRQLRWLLVVKRCQFKLLTLTFKSLHGDTPELHTKITEPVLPKETA